MDKIQQLRKAREAKGMELKEIAEITKIRSKYLKALEEEDYRVLPGGAYTIGFLRSYARFLELDADSLVNSFRMKSKFETAMDDTTKAINRRQRNHSLIVRILHCIGK